MAVPQESELDSSDEPTSVPSSFRMAAVASVAGLRDTCGNVPLDACVPVRLIAAVPTNLEAQSEWLLLHVDGERSLRDIAARAEITLSETIEAYLDLLMRGLVTVAPEEERS